MVADSQNPETKLAAWLAEAPVKMKDVAARAGMTPEHLRNIAAGIRGCTYEKAEKLSTITGGVVSVADIMSKAARRATRQRRQARQEASP